VPQCPLPVSEPLALLGGAPALPEPPPPYRSLGDAERAAVDRVVESGVLSGFYGSAGPEFLGGPMVRELERAWAERFGVRHAVSMNSATSGLIAAMGAIGISPGDEVIVPPYTMSATVVAPLFYGGVPVFADIDPETFCIDPDAVRRAIGPRTRAIVAVDLFGHPARLAELRAIADEHGVALVEDSAQAPLASEHGRLAGTVADVGIYSLNYHKHIHTGEGGVCVTADDELAERLTLIRNHGENVVEDLGVGDLTNMVGFNFRMTELSAAVGIEQLARADEHVRRRVDAAERLSGAVEGLAGLAPAAVRDGCRHVYYVWTVKLDEEALGVSRAAFSRALEAEGVPHAVGYVRPLYLLPAFQRRIAIGRDGFPLAGSDVSYEKGICPVAERMHERELILFETCMYDLSGDAVDGIAAAFRKVHAARAELCLPS
jgi:perosamine synthetase